PASDPACDVSRRTVRVLGRRGNGFILFEFSIGWSELTVELMLPEPAFEAFCLENRVHRLDDAPDQPHCDYRQEGDDLYEH
ncbi:MAG: phenol hydroxylase subunit, partial [Pseudomonadales bacterium]|nr:phenol hydroxylase subunit [Pseudomonadales bacterium]